MRSKSGLLLVLALVATLPIVAEAKAPPEEVAKLDGPELTCQGAVRAGSASGIPEFTGKYVGTWPGMKNKFGYEAGPFAADKPLFTITSQNMSKYADKLTEGQKALLQKYPQNYRMKVYPSRRDLGLPKWVCDVTKYNAANAHFVDDNQGIVAQGGAPAFPLPKTGLEAIWASKSAYRAYTEKVTGDIANVYGDGTIAWGRNQFRTMNVMNRVAKERPMTTEKITSYFYTGYLLPERDRGFVAVGFQVSNYKDGSTQAWQYLPGTRRVRQAPEVGYDYPVPPAGLHTTDEDYGFNGATDRYTWKLVGKKEMYVPYHNFKINDPSLKLKDITTPGSINPEYVRYELHRVWVVEATLKTGVRHIYAKRTIYIDEDSWQILTADHYDGRGQLWRVPMILYFYSQESSAHHRGVQVFHDLIAGVYEANNLINERKPDEWWRINTPMTPAQFSPEAAARAGR